MLRLPRSSLGLLPLLILRSLSAQELERAFCDDGDPANRCPGEECLCVDDTLEVVFEGDLARSVFEYEAVPPEGLSVPSLVARGEGEHQVRAWVFGVAHDESLLTLSMGDLSVQGTDAEGFLAAGDFIVRRVVPGGYIVASIPNKFARGPILPPGRATLIKATYTLRRDAGVEGTVLRFSEALGNPPIIINFTIDELSFPPMVERDEMDCINGRDDDGDGFTDRDDDDCVVRNGVSRQPRTLVDGLIRRAAAAPAPFRRGDADGDGKVNITDAILVIQHLVGGLEPRFACEDVLDTNDDGRLTLADGLPLLRFLFQDGPPLPAPSPACAADPTGEALVCRESNCTAG